MGKSKSFPFLSEVSLLLILRRLPLQKVLQLRPVCRQWKRVIETQICHPKRSLKLFGSFKAVLDYYQFVNRDYHQQAQGLEQKGHFVGSDFLHLDNFHSAINDYHAYFPKRSGSCGDGDFLSFSLSSEPEDDHLAVTCINYSYCLLIKQLFPTLTRLVLYQVRISNSLRCILSLLGMANSIEIYHRLIGPAGVQQPNRCAMELAIIPDIIFETYINVTIPNEAVINPLRSYLKGQFLKVLPSLKSLALDGVMIYRYRLLDMLFHLSKSIDCDLQELKLFQIDSKHILTSTILSSVSMSGFTRTLTRLTIDQANYELLRFFCANFVHITYLDITAHSELKSYDLLAGLSNLTCLEELRLRSSEPNFFLPLELNYIFWPFSSVKRLHLFLVNLTVDKLYLLTERLFSSLEQLVLDVGQFCCECDTKQAELALPASSPEANKNLLFGCFPSPGAQKRPRKCIQINSPVVKGLQTCSDCFPQILTRLEKECSLFSRKMQIYLYVSHKVDEIFFRLNQKYFYKNKSNFRLPFRSGLSRETNYNRPSIMNRMMEQINNIRFRNRTLPREVNVSQPPQLHQQPVNGSFPYFDHWNEDLFDEAHTDEDVSDEDSEHDDDDSFNEDILLHLGLDEPLDSSD